MNRRRFLVTAGVATVGLAGCLGDGDENESGIQGMGGSTALSFDGQLDGFDGEEGDITPDYAHMSAYDALEAGFLEADGQFSVDIEQADLEPEDETTLRDTLTLRCGSEIEDQPGDATEFTWFTHLRVSGIDRDEVSFITAMTDPDGCEPSFANCPNAEAEYVTWVYATEAYERQATCDGHELDVDLEAGWNVVLQDEYDRYAQRTVSVDSMDTAFETVEWYYNDQ